MSEESLGKDLKAAEAALGSLVPRSSRIDRDRLMFLAGQAAGRGQGSGVGGQDAEPDAVEASKGGQATHGTPGSRKGEAPAEPLARGRGSEARGRVIPSWCWPAATAAMVLVSVTLGGMLWWRPAPETIERIVYVQVAQRAPAPPTVVPDLAPESAAPRIASSLGSLVLGGSIQADYLRLRNQVLVSGLDALPEPRHAASNTKSPEPSDYRQLLISALRSKRET
ncbi:MAG: hypothetical protein ACYC35_04580 [Pirellulales bacterium]